MSLYDCTSSYLLTKPNMTGHLPTDIHTSILCWR